MMLRKIYFIFFPIILKLFLSSQIEVSFYLIPSLFLHNSLFFENILTYTIPNTLKMKQMKKKVFINVLEVLGESGQLTLYFQENVVYMPAKRGT